MTSFLFLMSDSCELSESGLIGLRSPTWNIESFVHKCFFRFFMISQAHLQPRLKQLCDFVHIQIVIECRDFAQCLRNDAQIAAQLTHSGRYTFSTRQNVDGLRVGIVLDAKWTLNALGKESHAIFGFLERIRVIVCILIGCNDAFLFACLFWIKAFDFLFCRNCVLQFGHWW